MAYFDQPIQFIAYNSLSKKLEITEESKLFFSSIKGEHISVIVIVGAYRTGKSFLLNRLRGSQKGFVLGDSVYGCTKGIWIWGKPIERAGKTFLLMDTEGLGDFERDKDYDAQIFVLSVLLSSSLIFNKMSTIDERSLRELELVVEISKQVRFDQENSQEDSNLLAQTFPHFYFVIRDFMLRLEGPSGKMTPNQYLEEALNVISGNEENNQIKSVIKTCFPKRKCFTLPRPIGDEEKLLNIENLNYLELNETFRIKCEECVDEILTSATPMKMTLNSQESIPINGTMFLKLAESYVECFNLGKIPSVKLNYTSVCEGETQLALQEAIQFYKSSMEEFFLTVDKTPIEQDLLNEVHDELLGTTIELFGQKSKGESSSVNNITFLLLQNISEKGLFQEYCNRNDELSKDCCEEVYQLALTELNYFIEEIQKSPQIITLNEFNNKTEEITYLYEQQSKGRWKVKFLNEINQEIQKHRDYITLKIDLADINEKSKLVLENINDIKTEYVSLQYITKVCEEENQIQTEEMRGSMQQLLTEFENQIQQLQQQQTLTEENFKTELENNLQKSRRDNEIKSQNNQNVAKTSHNTRLEQIKHSFQQIQQQNQQLINNLQAEIHRLC